MASFRRDDSEQRSEATSADPDIVLDVSGADATRRRLRKLAHPSHFPDSVPCPECQSPSQLDAIDLRNDVREQHCPKCGHSWSVDVTG
jgi:predicted Zn finger-like uncharacterized protein